MLFTITTFLFGCAALRAPSESSGDVVTFTAQTVDGSAFVFDAMKSQKPNLLVFWASWCKSCRYETPEVIALSETFAGKLNIIGVSVDQDPEKAKEYIAEHRFSYPNLIDSDARLADLLRVRATPTLVLVDNAGKVILRSHRVDQRLKETVHRLVETPVSSSSMGY